MNCLIISVTAIILGGLWLLRPPRRATPIPQASASDNYSDAQIRLQQMLAADGPDVKPVCRTQALTHGQRTERVIVFLHGYTNCPRQFLDLGELFHRRGYTVLVPRLPYHGLTNRLTPAIGKLTADDLIQSLNATLDIAHGLGEQVTVAGLSVGGVMAAYAAQFRPDVDQAVLLAPLLGVGPIPRPLVTPLRNLAMHIPNIFIWWDAKTRDTGPGPQHAYPRFGTRGIAEALRLTDLIMREARQKPPVSRDILVVTTANDTAIDNQRVTDLVNLWRGHSPASVRTFQFPPELPIQHDFIDPDQTTQQVAEVYPVLVELIDKRAM